MFAGGTHSVASAEYTPGFTAWPAADPLLSVPGSGTRPGFALRVEPQPVRSTATIRFRLARPSNVEIGIYDLAGRRVLLADRRRARDAGAHSVVLQRYGLQAGIYVVRIVTAEASAAEKFVVLP